MKRCVRCPHCGYTGTVTVPGRSMTPTQVFLLWALGIICMFLFCSIGVILA